MHRKRLQKLKIQIFWDKNNHYLFKYGQKFDLLLNVFLCKLRSIPEIWKVLVHFEFPNYLNGSSAVQEHAGSCSSRAVAAISLRRNQILCLFKANSPYPSIFVAIFCPWIISSTIDSFLSVDYDMLTVFYEISHLIVVKDNCSSSLWNK